MTQPQTQPQPQPPAEFTDALRSIRLCRGVGTANKEGCWMAALSYYAGEKWTDQVACVDPVIRGICIIFNDLLPNEHRSSAILPNLFTPLGTAETLETSFHRLQKVTSFLTQIKLPRHLYASTSSSYKETPRGFLYDLQSSLTEDLIKVAKQPPPTNPLKLREILNIKDSISCLRALLEIRDTGNNNNFTDNYTQILLETLSGNLFRHIWDAHDPGIILSIKGMDVIYYEEDEYRVKEFVRITPERLSNFTTRSLALIQTLCDLGPSRTPISPSCTPSALASALGAPA